MSDALQKKLTRREALRGAAGGAALVGLGAAAGALGGLGRARGGERVWQIDPQACVQCGNCATQCVLEPSAVKCVHAFELCYNCDLCFAYFTPEHTARTTGAENQVCPTGAITRTYVRDEKYLYTIDESLCVGCGKCVKRCNEQGAASLYLQVRHDRCLNCSQCTIAAACPADAFRRVPAETPYLPKTKDGPRR